MTHMSTHMKIITAGKVNAPPKRKKAPGKYPNVALYICVYIGAKTSGVKASPTPINELSLP